MLPRYRISLYSRGPRNCLVAGGFFRVAALYVWVAAGFASSSSSEWSSLGGWMRDFFIFFCFLVFLCFSEVSVEVMSMVSVVSGSRATFRLGSGVIAMVIDVAFGVGGGLLSAVAVGAKVSLVCFGPGELVFEPCELVASPLAPLVCFVFIPPRGEASLPAVLVGFLFFGAARLVIVTLVASVRSKRKAESGVQ